jgi:hypothetical protein
MQKPNSSISSFKQLLLQLILPFAGLFAVLCLVLDPLLTSHLILNVENEGPYKVHRLLHEPRETESPVFGNSRALNGFNIDSMGIEGFNYGINGTHFEAIHFLLEQELAKDKRSDIFVCFDFGFFQEGIGDPYNYVASADNEAVVAMLKRAGAYSPAFHIPLIRYYGAFERFVNRYVGYFYGGSSNCSYVKGSSLCDLNISDAHRKLAERISLRFGYDPEMDSMFTRLLAEGNPHQRRIWLIVPPYFPPIYRDQKEIDAILAYLQKISEVPSVGYYFGDGRTFGEESFRDVTHLNREGSIKFSRELRAFLHSQEAGEPAEAFDPILSR